MSFTDEFVSFVLFIFVAIVSFALTFFLLAFLWCAGPGKWACEDFGKGMQAKTEYHFWYGCFVAMPDGKILVESDARKVMQQEYRLELNQKNIEAK